MTQFQQLALNDGRYAHLTAVVKGENIPSCE